MDGLINTAFAVLVIAIMLGLVLFVGGKPNDIGGVRWQVWLITGIVMLGLIFFLSRSVGRMQFPVCDPRNDRC